MSFMLGGSDAPRPTFFELVAAERLMPSLKAAASYSLQVLSQQRPWVYRLLAYEDELFAAVALILDHGSLANAGGTFSESLYGLRRAPAETSGSGDSSSGGSSGGSVGGHESRISSGSGAAAQGQQAMAVPMLTRRQQQAALALSVLLPYAHAKLSALYERRGSMPPQLLRLGDFRSRQQQQPASERQQEQQEQQQQDQQQQGQSWRRQQLQQLDARLGGRLFAAADRLAHWRRHLRALALHAFIKAYPLVHAGQEGSKFALQLLYLMDATAFYSPALWLLRQRIVRISGGELQAVDRARARQREAALRRARDSASLLWRLVRQGYLRASWLFTDHTRNALILSVFAFKALEWWYDSAEGKLAAQQVLPVPPPPPAPPPHPDGLPLPADPADCAVCGLQRTNPATLEVSGYVFCYPCAVRWVREHGCCPVTRLPATEEHIRRIRGSEL